MPYHLTSLILHIASGLLLLYWLCLLGFKPPAAGCAMLLFLVHPIQTEAVAYISGLSDPLAMVFLLGALVVHTTTMVRPVRAPQWLVAVVVMLLFGLALFTRESSVVFVPMAAAVTLFAGYRYPTKGRRGQWGALGLYTGVAVVYIVMKFSVLNFGGGFGLTDQVNVYTEHLWVRLVTFAAVLWDYAVLIGYPQDLFYEKPYAAYTTLVSWRGLFALVGLSAALYVLRHMHCWPRVALGVGIFLVALAPFSGIVPLNAIFLEHWLYVPMIGVAILVAVSVEVGLRHGALRPWVVGLTVVVLGLLSVRTYARAAQWADIESFYLNEIAHGGSTTRVLNNLGMYYASRGQWDKAIDYYKKAIASGLPMPQPHHNLANIYIQAGRSAEAVNELKQALTIDHQFLYSLNFLAKIFDAAGDLPRMQMVVQAINAVGAGQPYDFDEFLRVVFGP